MFPNKLTQSSTALSEVMQVSYKCLMKADKHSVHPVLLQAEQMCYKGEFMFWPFAYSYTPGKQNNKNSL